MIKRTFISLILAGLTLPSLSAQEPAGNAVDPSHFPGLPPAEPEDILCRCVSTFLLKKNEVFYFKMGTTFHEVNLVGEGVSLPFPVRGSTTFALYKKVPAGEDKTEYKAVVEQVLEGAGKEHLVILKRKNDQSPLKSYSYNLSKSEFPANSIYFFNESPAPLGLQVNTTKTVVQPFKRYTYNYQNTSRDTYTSAKVIMRYKGENKIMASKRLRLVPGRRIILIAFPSKSRAKLGSTPLGMIIHQDKP